MCEIELPRECVLVFDLDDTLFAERDFVRSGFRQIGLRLEEAGVANAFGRLENYFDQGLSSPIDEILRQEEVQIEKSELLCIYREHQPSLRMDPSVAATLQEFSSRNYALGIITDGRSRTQRNKIAALGLQKWIREIVISEEFGSAKPAAENYLHFEEKFPGRSYVYVGDNLQKDFVTPNRLGWTTVGIRDQGKNIHPQHFESIPPNYLPRFLVAGFAPPSRV